jgi:mannose-6-phosphate isomerase
VPGLLEKLGQKIGSEPSPSAEEALFLVLWKKYPADISTLTPFILKLLHLHKGQALFIQPGIPHAYMLGNIIECMATSDNVIRAGLTEKFKDIPALLEIVDYRSQPVVEDYNGAAEQTYRTPWEEFRISRIDLQPGRMRENDPGNESPRMILVTAGGIGIHWEESCKQNSCELQAGQSCLIPACLSNFSLLSNKGAELYWVEVPA